MPGSDVELDGNCLANSQVTSLLETKETGKLKLSKVSPKPCPLKINNFPNVF